MLGLTDPADLELAGIGRQPPVPPSELVGERSVAIVDNGEPLLTVEGVDCRQAYVELGIEGQTVPMRLRSGVIDRLCLADKTLPSGFSLVVLDGYRTLPFQRALHQYYYAGIGGAAPTRAGYVSDPDDARLVPPHTTGGAVDLTLAWHGVPMALGTDFDAFDEAAWSRAYEAPGAAEPVRSLRRLLAHVLSEQGFCPYPLEWWHFSYGDQMWAFNRGMPHAEYGPVR